MTEKYLQSLIDGLNQKITILDKLSEFTEEQQRIVGEAAIDWEAFDRTIDDKDELLQKLATIDEGFQAVYDRIKGEVSANKDKYREYILILKQQIQLVTEKSTSLMALEQRTKAKVSSGFGTQRQQIRSNKESSKVASSYYNTMNRMNYIDPQLMDWKK